MVLLSDTTGLRHCGYGKHCVARSGDASTLRNETLVLDDYKIYLTEEQQETVAQRLRDIGFLKQSDGWIDYKKYLIRLLYNPKRSIIREILQEKQKLGLPTYQIGVHLRCGGFLADVNEETAMITPRILGMVPQMMRELMVNASISKDRAFFYLSTDSSIAARNITAELHPIPVLSTSRYHRGHSTLAYVDEYAVRRALIELYLISQSRALLLTSASTFSEMIKWMSDANTVSTIYAPYVSVGAHWGRRVNLTK